MKILIFTPAYRNREVVNLCYQRTAELIEQVSDRFDISVLVVYSEAEDCGLALDYGFKTWGAQNKPLGNKKNEGISHALTLEWDYLLELDSNGVITTELLDDYTWFFENEIAFFGTNRIAFLEWKSKRLLNYTIKNGGVWVSGRCIRRDVVETVHYSGGLWDSDIDSGVGVNQENRIAACYPKVEDRLRIIHTDEPHLLDIKSGGNVTAFDILAAHHGEAVEITEGKKKYLEVFKF